MKEIIESFFTVPVLFFFEKSVVIVLLCSEVVKQTQEQSGAINHTGKSRVLILLLCGEGVKCLVEAKHVIDHKRWCVYPHGRKKSNCFIRMRSFYGIIYIYIRYFCDIKRI